MSIINTRSPYYIKIEPTNPGNTLEYAKMELYIYTGTLQSTPASTTLRYTLTKTPISSDNFVVFEISELVRDFLEIEFNGDYSSYAVWVRPVFEYKTTQAGVIYPTPVDYVGLDGYGYFEEGVNPSLSEGLLMSNNTIYVLDNTDLHIPVWVTGDLVVKFYCGPDLMQTSIYESTQDTAFMVQYASLDSLANYQQLMSGADEFVNSSCLEAFFDTLDSCVTKVVIESPNGTETINVRYLDECRYTPYRVTFVNKFGAFQDIWFFKKSTEKMSVKSEQFKASIFSQSDLSYKTYQHQQQSFLVNGKDSITMNTGYLNDDYNKVIEELLLSEQIWYLDGTQTIPLNITNKSVSYKTVNNDKLVDYTLDFERAFDKINNIR